MNRQSIIILVLAVMFCVGGWLVALQSWNDAATPSALGGLFMNLASVAAGAFGVNLQKKG